MAGDLDDLAKLTRDSRPKEKSSTSRQYEAFTTQPRTQTLRISRGNGVDDYQSYAYFFKVKGDRRGEKSFRMFFTFENVRVTGESLGPVMAAIGEKRCDSITEFNKSDHDAPAAGEPIITKIELINKKIDEALTEEEVALTKG